MLQQTQTDCLGQIRLHALCYSSLGQNYSTALGPEQWSVRQLSIHKKWRKKETIYLWLCSHYFSCDGCRCAGPSRSTFPLCVRWGFLRENQTKSDKRNISPGVLTIENCGVFCLQQPSSVFWTLSVTSLETIWDCVGNVFVCVRLSSEGEYYVCGGGLMRLFLCRQSPSCTVNDFSTSSGVMDNHNERVGWELLA